MLPSRSLALALSVIASLLGACGDSGNPPPSGGAGSYLGSRPIQTVGGKVSLGEISPCSGPVRRKVTITNQSATPVTILNYQSTCPCLSAKLEGDSTIGPGEQRSVEVEAKPGGVGDRSVSVEFGGKGGFLGSIRVDWIIGASVACVPESLTLAKEQRDFAVDVDIIGSDGRSITVLGIDPPVGTVAVREGTRCKVVLSVAEALAFVEGPQGRTHPGTVLDPGGQPTGLRVAIATDHPSCPTAFFDFSFAR